MPIYEYECDECFLIIEKLQEMGSPPLKCPKCGVDMNRKPAYPAMVKIKGSGGYPSRRKMIKDSAPYCRG